MADIRAWRLLIDLENNKPRKTLASNTSKYGSARAPCYLRLCNLTAGKVSKLLSNIEFAKDETSEVERLAVGTVLGALGLGPVQQLRFQNRRCQITAKSRPNLANRAFSKLDRAIWQGPVLKTELLNGAGPKEDETSLVRVSQGGVQRLILRL
jgi:hypothetical protein